jgi:hypothetical protein
VVEEEFKEWVEHPVTKAFYKALDNNREELKEGLVRGLYEDESEIKGRCAAVLNVLLMTYEDLVEGLRYEK